MTQHWRQTRWNVATGSEGVAGVDELDEVTQERLDTALAWVAAARSLDVLGNDDGHNGVFLQHDCLHLEIRLEDVGARPAAVELEESGVASLACLTRAEEELDRIDPDKRPSGLLGARAQLWRAAMRLQAEQVRQAAQAEQNAQAEWAGAADQVDPDWTG